MKSSKSILHELYQKSSMKPIYKHINLGDDSIPKWKSILYTMEGKEIESRVFPNKSLADLDVAERYLGILNSKKKVFYQKPSNPDYIILIDLDNIPKAIKYDWSNYPNALIIGFVGKCNSGIFSKKEEIMSQMELRIVDSGSSEAADHAISFEAGLLSSKYSKKKWILLSADKFMDTTSKLLLERNIYCRWLTYLEN